MSFIAPFLIASKADLEPGIIITPLSERVVRLLLKNVLKVSLVETNSLVKFETILHINVSYTIMYIKQLNGFWMKTSDSLYTKNWKIFRLKAILRKNLKPTSFSILRKISQSSRITSIIIACSNPI